MLKFFPLILFFQIAVNAQSVLVGPMLGHVDEKSAKIWCCLDMPGEVTLKFSENSTLANSKSITQKDFETGTFELTELKPNTQYFYQLNTNRFAKSHIASFKTAPVAGTPVKMRFSFTSCSGHTSLSEDWSWDDLSKQKNLNMILLLGDNHYADTTNPDAIAKHYISRRSLGGFRKITSDVPTYGIWDDHDYGPNNSHGETPGKENSLAVFKKFWANPAFGENDNPGCYFTYTYGDIQFIMLDSRYHRTPNESMKADDPAKTMLGAKQLAWLEKTLKNSTAKFKFVANGSEFQTQGSSDGFSGFQVEQKKVLDLFRDIEGVVLLSGDRHFTAGYQIHGKTIEICSGPFGSSNAKAAQTDDLFFAFDQGKFFSIFEVDTTVTPPKLKLEVHSTGKGLVLETDFSWEQVNGKEKILKKEIK